MLLKLFVAVFAFIWIANANIESEIHHPNVIIMHANNLQWNELGIHANRKDSENSSPNIDYLAYSGIVLNRFYANGGIDSLLSGCHESSHYANPNLLEAYFGRNGYKVNFIARNQFDKISAFEWDVLDAISVQSDPFLIVADFGRLGDGITLPFIDEIVASVVTKANNVGVINNTIMLFLSLPDVNESPLESNIRRTAFIYSPLLKLQQRVSNQMIHIIDLLPTLVAASSLQWRTKDLIYIDGINQWHALNNNDDERLDVYGNNFFISHFWKLTFGVNGGAGFYGSLSNENLESDKDTSGYELNTYTQAIFSSDVHAALNTLSASKVVLSKSRAKVHCNLKDANESAVKDIKCSRATPCLFDLLEDPCEFDNKHEHEFDLRRDHMKDMLERFLRGEKTDEISVKSTEETAGTLDDGALVGIILGGTIVGCIGVFIVVVCVKERCNQKRSVYYDKAKQKSERQQARAANGSASPNDPNEISVIARNMK